MMRPEISIGIPFHDPGSFFAGALRSVFSQTLTSWELILVDDGSQDGSLALARSLQDPRVRVLCDGMRRGLPARLNQIALAARAPLLARMDADDLMHPERLQLQLAALRDRSSQTVVGTLAYAIDRLDQPVGLSPSAAPGPLPQGPTFIHPSILAATAWFRANPYSEEPAFARCEDAELWLRCASSSTYLVLPQALMYYREVGTFSLENYLATQRGLREIVRRRPSGPWIMRQRLLLRLRLKSLAARLASACGASDVLVRRRSLPLLAAQAEEARSGLARIRDTALPRS